MNEKFICVTNRKLVEGDFLSWLDRILDRGINGLPAPDRLILREKDLSPADYTSLARRVLDLCSTKGKICILHSYPEVALELGCEHIHLPLEKLRHMSEEEKSFFRTLGASVHSPEAGAAGVCVMSGYMRAAGDDTR